MKNLKILLLVVLAGFVISSCKKEAATNYPVNIRMTDGPGPYEAVLIDLQEVKVTGNNDQEINLDVNAGIYNLLDFTNGKDTLIATGTLDFDTIQQIRLILGPDNSIVIAGETFPLSTPSAEQSGLKLQVHQALEAGVEYEILIDFDANKSILRTGNGAYKLKPVLRTIQTALSGAISGTISPAGALAIVSAEYDGESYSTAVAEDGSFLLIGLPEGNYTLTVTPELPLNPVTIADILIEIGVTNYVGEIVLQ